MTEDLAYQEMRWRSEYSLLRAYGKMDDVVERAQQMGMPTVCLTEDGTMRGAYHVNETCNLASSVEGSTPIRPIFGCLFNVVPDHTIKGLTQEQVDAATAGLTRPIDKRRAIKEAERKHNVQKVQTIAIRALDNTGLTNLYKLSSIAWTTGYYWNPRIDLATLKAHSEGLSIGIGGVDGVACEEIIAGRLGEGLDIIQDLSDAFSGRLYLEIQPHPGTAHSALNRALLRIGKALDIPVIAVNDVHYINEGDTDAHTIILCLRAKKALTDPDHPVSPTGYHLRTGREMLAAFQKHHPSLDVGAVTAAILRTTEVAERHQAKMVIDRFACLVPEVEYEHAKDRDDNAELRTLCVEGWVWRDIPGRAAKLGIPIRDYTARLHRELTAISNQKFPRYFLIVRDLINWSRSQGIPTGPGRGSAAGSLVCYLLGITAIDPMEHSLMFERFISPARIDMPDIDMDFADHRREEVINYLHDKYGHDKVSLIATIGRLKGKAALKDVSRVLGVPYAEVNEITGSIVERSSGDERASQTVMDSFKEFKVCQEFDRKYPRVLPLVMKLEGHAKQIGVHAAGVITSPDPLSQVVPVETHMRNNSVIKLCAFDMYGAGAMGLLKLDVLGLRTLSVLGDAVDMIKERHGIDIDLESIDLNEQPVLDRFTDHEYVGIFQYDSTGAHAACEGIPFTSFEDIAAMTALNRPGTMRSGLATQFKKRKLNPALIKPFHPLVDEICKDTLGILVYQEQVIRIFTEVAGYTPGTADSLRKKIAKKWGDEAIGRERQKFVEGAMARGVPEGDAGKLMDNITFFGSYGFNKSHASAYGAIAYWGMWLKHHYPLEFLWSLMKNEPKRPEIARFAKEAKRLGIGVLPPDINYSGVTFSIDADGNIRSSLADVKNVGKTAIGTIVAEQPFTSVSDLIQRCSGRALNSRVLDSLIRAGAMRSLLPNTKWALEHIKEKGGWLDLGRRKRSGWEVDVDRMAADSASLPDYSEEDALYIASEVSPLGGGKHPMTIYDGLCEAVMPDTPWVALDRDDFWDRKTAYVKGVLIEIKYNQVGDFHTVEPDDAEKQRIGWGKRYSNVNLEDESGTQHRIKVDTDIFEDFREIIDKGVGTCVAMHVSVNKRFHSIKAHYMADLEVMRQKHKLGLPLATWERCVSLSDHPARSLKSAKPFPGARRGRHRLTGYITNVKTTFDKNGNQMAFFGLEDGYGGHADIVAFASTYDFHAHAIQRGARVEVAVKGDRGSWLMADEGITRVFK